MSLLSREDYLFGDCNVFAVAVKSFLKGHIVCLLENRLITTSGVMVEREALIHCFLKITESDGFDARGLRSIKEIEEEYQIDCTELPSWTSENKTDQEVIGYGYQHKGSSVVIDIANARKYIQDNLMEEIEYAIEKQKLFNQLVGFQNEFS